MGEPKHLYESDTTFSQEIRDTLTYAFHLAPLIMSGLTILLGGMTGWLLVYAFVVVFA